MSLSCTVCPTLRSRPPRSCHMLCRPAAAPASSLHVASARASSVHVASARASSVHVAASARTSCVRRGVKERGGAARAADIAHRRALGASSSSVPNFRSDTHEGNIYVFLFRRWPHNTTVAHQQPSIGQHLLHVSIKSALRSLLLSASVTCQEAFLIGRVRHIAPEKGHHAGHDAPRRTLIWVKHQLWVAHLEKCRCNRNGWQWLPVFIISRLRLVWRQG